ncbi:MAG: AarF/ABC1/UbiB kinase family protein [Acidobacteria bacterium]|nr:AarF/ABC1/UbiB kinase family protein [Acidobacteriota bacterium]
MNSPSNPVAAEAASALAPGFELLIEKKVPGLTRRFLTTLRHLLALALGGFRAYALTAKLEGKKGLKIWLARCLSFWLALPIRKDLRRAPFPVQLRRRLEILGPTYIKLGQILSLREDILPHSITTELKNLLDRLPVVPFHRYLELIEEGLGGPWQSHFQMVDAKPIGSASIAQIHRAVTVDGQEVILKVVKPGIRKTLERDTSLLLFLGSILQIFLARFQPKRVLREFCEYTMREVDLRLEADNAETFASNFRDEPDIVFPKIYRKHSGRSILCMEFFKGHKPDAPEAQALPLQDREKLIDLGACAIIRMLYRDGFFHADLHPGNLIVLPGPKCGFIDLGMIGRFDEELRRTLLYYYYCLVTGDAENAARYLTSVSYAGPNGNPDGFKKAVEDISRRWHRTANFDDFSLAQLIMESVNLGATYRMFFPVEMVLMVKALVTFEGVGQILKPGFDVAAVSKKHINKLFFAQFHPMRLIKESLRGAPEIVDALVKAPLLITEGLKFIEKTTKRPAENPLSGLRGTLFAGACMVAAAILVAAKGPWQVYSALFAVSIVLALRKGN